MNIIQKFKTGTNKERIDLSLSLLSLVSAFVGIVLYLILPLVSIASPVSSVSTTYSYSLSPMKLSGFATLFGRGTFSYLAITASNTPVVITQRMSFNFYGLLTLAAALAAAGFGLASKATRTNQKVFGVVAVVLLIMSSAMSILSPAFFVTANHVGAGDWTATSDILQYWKYDSFSAKNGIGSIVAAVFFFISAAFFVAGSYREWRTEK